jgi:uncharacterized DUF497 family protein
MDLEYRFHGILFAWDSDKAATNLAKHRVSFETACEAFLDPFVLLVDDEIIGAEVRDTIIGVTERWKMPCVVYAVRVGDRYRLISARPATAAERQAYEQQ